MSATVRGRVATGGSCSTSNVSTTRGAWAWEFVTEVLGIDPDRLWVTVHVDDDEAEAIWRDDVGFPAERIQRLDEAGGVRAQLGQHLLRRPLESRLHEQIHQPLGGHRRQRLGRWR